MRSLDLPDTPFDPGLEPLRRQVREFLAEELADYPAALRAENWARFDRDFGRKLGARGWLGMTWPKRYGGGERPYMERYVVWEELLAAGAPLVSSLPMDRQNGPLLLAYGSESIKADLLPRMARGELVFCLGMSEPGSGSDLASVKSKAVRTATGWRLEGRKIWSSVAHESDYMIGIFRSSPAGDTKHAGLSQFLIDLRTPGITIRPILDLQGHSHFNECTFDAVEIPGEALLGNEGDGWKQVTHELSFERSGPERYLSNHQLLVEMVAASAADDTRAVAQIGELVAEMAALRDMSRGVATLLASGQPAGLPAALVKDRGTAFEQRIPEAAHALFGRELGDPADTLSAVAAYSTQASPQYTIRGGTREILRGIIARGMQA